MKNYKTKEGEITKNRSLDIPKVYQYMTPAAQLITFKKGDLIDHAVNTLLKYRITGAPVLDENKKVIGMIDDKDCLKILIGSAYYNQPSGHDTVGDYMDDIMKSINAKENIVTAANIFLQDVYKRLIVLDDDGKLVGQISRQDILSAIADMNAQTW